MAASESHPRCLPPSSGASARRRRDSWRATCRSPTAAPPRGVNAVAHALRRQLTHEHAQLTPVERRRRPRVVSLEAVGQAPGVAFATAMIDDGGITTYPLRLRLERGADGWAVSAVDGG